MPNDSEAQSNLRYELKINEMILVSADKQTLIDCVAAMLGIQNVKLHEIICSQLTKCLEQFTLPRKLSYVRKDSTIIDDYKKYPQLVNFMKITLQMVSQIFQIKITVFYLNSQEVLTGLIINEKAYQSEIKIGRINNSFYEIKDNFNSHSHNSSAKLDPSSSSQSYKYYQIFDIDPLPKKPESKPLDALNFKSFSHLPMSPALKKNTSLCEERKITIPEAQNFLQASIPLVPSLDPIKKFDEISLQNAVDQQQTYTANNLTDSIKFGVAQQNLTQSLTIQPPVPTLTEQPVIHPQEQAQNQNAMYYGYYSQHIYYPPYMIGQNGNRNEIYPNNFGNASTASVSPGKNQVRRQNSTLEINQNERYTGRLKFFDEGKNYGFIIMDADESDIFVHCDDLQKAGISKQRVRSYKQSEGIIRFSFKVMSYFGKYKESRKAVDLIITDDGLGMPSLYT